LTNAIIEFQSNSDYSWQLIMTALSQEKALLNSFSTSAVGNLTLFLPSDAGFLNLNLASLSQNDLYTYLQYHVAINAPLTATYIRTYLGDDIKVNETHVTSAFDKTAVILGSEIVGENVALYFLDNVLTPPVSLAETAKRYEWDQLSAVLEAAKNANITYTTSKDNTYLIPSEKSIADFVEKNCPPSQWNLNFLQILLQSLSFSSGRYYSSELSPEGGTILSNSNIDATYSIEDGIVSFTEFGVTAPVTKADIFVNHGVAHVIDALSLPSIKGYCQ